MDNIGILYYQSSLSENYAKPPRDPITLAMYLGLSVYYYNYEYNRV